MALFNNVPVFLDNFAGFSKQQVDFINILVKTARRSFEEKALQKQKTAPKLSKFTISSYNRVLDLKDYLYSNFFSITFILNPFNFEQGGRYPLFEVKHNIVSFNYEGSNSDNKPASPLSGLGHIEISRLSDKYIFYFVMDAEEWPKDSQDNKVQYSVYVGGRVG